ncbi:MAG: tetratricopeptide repeat protein [Deltaproteobacteria bacterium]|nr:tetratricopeptide repeat protein [Candidatus Zymogenaceae bacterium]
MKNTARIVVFVLFLLAFLPCLALAETADQWNAKGLAFMGTGDLDKALDCYNKAVKADPRYPYAYINRAWLYNLTGEFAKALPDCTKAIDLKPAYYLAAAYNNRAWAYCGLGRYEEALPDCDTAIRLDPTGAYAYNNRGWALCGLARYKEALDALDRAIDLKPDDFLSFTYINRGWAYSGLGEYDDALDDYEESCDRGNQIGCEAYRTLKAKMDE